MRSGYPTSIATAVRGAIEPNPKNPFAFMKTESLPIASQPATTADAGQVPRVGVKIDFAGDPSGLR